MIKVGDTVTHINGEEGERFLVKKIINNVVTLKTNMPSVITKRHIVSTRVCDINNLRKVESEELF